MMSLVAMRVSRVWNYDPISRGLKQEFLHFFLSYLQQQFGTMTRFLGD